MIVGPTGNSTQVGSQFLMAEHHGRITPEKTSASLCRGSFTGQNLVNAMIQRKKEFDTMFGFFGTFSSYMLSCIRTTWLCCRPGGLPYSFLTHTSVAQQTPACAPRSYRLASMPIEREP